MNDSWHFGQRFHRFVWYWMKQMLSTSNWWLLKEFSSFQFQDEYLSRNCLLVLKYTKSIYKLKVQYSPTLIGFLFVCFFQIAKYHRFDALWEGREGKMYPTMHLFWPLFNPTMHQICGLKSKVTRCILLANLYPNVHDIQQCVYTIRLYQTANILWFEQGHKKLPGSS